MKKILLSTLFILLATFSCKSAAEYRQERLAHCSDICKNHPEIEEMSRQEGGMFLVLFGGYQDIKCKCSRSLAKN